MAERYQPLEPDGTPMDTSDMSDEALENWRLEDLFGPLFDMVLRFEQVFRRKAIDKYDISDEDVDKYIAQFTEGRGFQEDEQAGLGSMFVHLMKQIKMERIYRKLGHMFQVVHTEEDGGLPIEEIYKRYRALENAGKVGSS